MFECGIQWEANENYSYNYKYEEYSFTLYPAYRQGRVGRDIPFPAIRLSALRVLGQNLTLRLSLLFSKTICMENLLKNQGSSKIELNWIKEEWENIFSTFFLRPRLILNMIINLRNQDFFNTTF